MPGTDKLRAQCEALLLPGEHILLEAEATCKLGALSEFGSGKAYLTDKRIIWIRRRTPLIRKLLFWIPDLVMISRDDVSRIRMTKTFWLAALLLEASGKTYLFRLGRGPYPLLRDNPDTTQQWYEEIGGS